MGKKELLFVYNADGGFFNTLTDHAHKLLSPATYPCNLCMVTFEGFAMKQEWKEFLASLGADIRFLHRNEFRAAHPALADQALPALFAASEGGPRLLLGPGEINREKELAGLIRLVRTALERAAGPSS